MSTITHNAENKFVRLFDKAVLPLSACLVALFLCTPENCKRVLASINANQETCTFPDIIDALIASSTGFIVEYKFVHIFDKPHQASFCPECLSCRYVSLHALGNWVRTLRTTIQADKKKNNNKV
ncbi:hypothetical protein U1Q18_003755 [Sarracenia purpurea var. burkii]